jgi:hypothetical protein
MARQKSGFVYWIAVFIGGIGGPLIAVSSAVFVYRLYYWRSHGKWLKTYTLKTMPDRWVEWIAVSTSELGIKKIVFWILDQDFFLIIFVLGCLFGVGSLLQEWVESKRKKATLGEN